MILRRGAEGNTKEARGEDSSAILSVHLTMDMNALLRPNKRFKKG